MSRVIAIFYTDYALDLFKSKFKNYSKYTFFYIIELKKIDGNVIRFSNKNLFSRLKFYSLLKKTLNKETNEIVFHNYTDVSFYLIYSRLKYKIKKWHYISDGIGSIYYMPISNIKLCLIYIILRFLMIKPSFPPFNFFFLTTFIPILLINHFNFINQIFSISIILKKNII